MKLLVAVMLILSTAVAFAQGMGTSPTPAAVGIDFVTRDGKAARIIVPDSGVLPVSGTVVPVGSDGGLPTSYATSPVGLFAACDCAAALIADGGTLPVGAFLAITNTVPLSDGGTSRVTDGGCGCEFIQPGANVSASKYWWIPNDYRDTLTARVTLSAFSSGTVTIAPLVRTTGLATAGDFTTYTAVNTQGTPLAVVGGVGAANSTTAPNAPTIRGGELALVVKCTVACVASGDGGTVRVDVNVQE